MTETHTESFSAALRLTAARPAASAGFSFARAVVLPGRGMMLLSLTALRPDGTEFDVISAPSLEHAEAEFASERGVKRGNASYSMGGAVLIPFANRIRGAISADGRHITTRIAGRELTIPANGGGKAPGAEKYAIHGFFLDTPAVHVRPTRRDPDGAEMVRGAATVGDFGGRWLSSLEVSVEHRLAHDAYTLEIRVRNVGDSRSPVGLGWHPYFAIPSGDRRQTRIRVPASGRAEVNDYDEVLPTGRIIPVHDTPYDFNAPGGRALGDLYLDDCFVQLEKRADGASVAEVMDPASGYGLEITATSPHVSAMQVFAPPELEFVVIEPQFNWADPYGAEWPAGTDTGMMTLAPGEEAVHAIELRLKQRT